MNREQELSLLLGMAYSLAKSQSIHMMPAERDALDYVENKINELFYGDKE